MPNDTMNFGVDLLPVTTETYNLGSENKKWNIFGNLTGNASTATFATSANILNNSYSNRPIDANIAHVENGGVVHFKATSSMASNKPMADGNILHFHWDTTTAWDSQLYIPDSSANSIQWRGHSTESAWGNWTTVLDSSNYNSYSPTLSGTGASGTWEINITGTATTASAINYTLATTTKAYLMASSDAPTSTTAARAAKGDTGVYLTTTEGELSAVKYSINTSGTEKVRLEYNSTDDSLDFVFI